MKTRLTLSAAFSLMFYLASSQVPQGFTYQAIARDGSGQIIANTTLPVRITIQTSLTGGTTIWEEEHMSVTSNQFGLIYLVVGTETKKAGTAATFSAIDWNAQPLYLKTTIRYPGTTWTVMGTTQLWSVPYSMVAKDVEGPITKLGITGTTTNMEEALFEVKNRIGQTVFAAVSYTHLRAHETVLDLVCRLLLEKKNKKTQNKNYMKKCDKMTNQHHAWSYAT